MLQGYNLTKWTFSGIGNSSGSGGNSNGVFAFGVNVGGGAARKTPSLPPLMLTTPSPMNPKNRQVKVHHTKYEVLTIFFS